MATLLQDTALAIQLAIMQAIALMEAVTEPAMEAAMEAVMEAMEAAMAAIQKEDMEEQAIKENASKDCVLRKSRNEEHVGIDSQRNC